MTLSCSIWPGLRRPGEDHPEPLRPLPVLDGPRPSWTRPAEPLDPCGAGPIQAGNTTAEDRS